MSIAIALLSCATGLAAGFFASRAHFTKAHRRQMARREREMTGAVEERLRAYVGLEEKVRALFAHLDRWERKTQDDLARTGMRLVEMGKAIGGSNPSGGAPEMDLGWLGDADGTVVEVKIEDGPSAPAAPGDIEQWRRRLEDLNATKGAELERQERLISELTERVRELQQSQSVTDADTSPGALRHELALWRERHLELERSSAAEVASLRERSDRLETCERELAAQTERAQSLAERSGELEQQCAFEQRRFETEQAAAEARIAEEMRRHGREVGDLRRRIGELEPFVERERAAAAELEHWRATAERQRFEFEALEQSAHEQRQRMAEELEQTRARLQSEFDALEAESGQRTARLEQQLAALEALRPDLEHACTKVQELGAMLSEREDQVAALEAQVAMATRDGEQSAARLADLESLLETARAECVSWRQRAEAAQSEREEKVRQLDGRLAELEDLSETLRGAVEIHLGRIAELENEEARLERELLESTQSLLGTRERLQQAEQTLETVSRLLREAHAKD